MATKNYQHAMTLRLNKKQLRLLDRAAKRMAKAGKANGRNDVIRYLIESWL